jgi:hypothetical protein
VDYKGNAQSAIAADPTWLAPNGHNLLAQNESEYNPTVHVHRKKKPTPVSAQLRDLVPSRFERSCGEFARCRQIG